jgi:hypothetical protein
MSKIGSKRVKPVNRLERTYGYKGATKVRYQLLQEKRWWGWKTIDEERVPDDVLISIGCFGDTGGWVSKFVSHGRFGRNGVVA